MVQMRIDQVGLPAVPAGRARTDGLSNGALVTVTNTTGGLTTHVRLLWVPPEDLTARATLISTGPTTWTFSPQAGTNGSYRIELIADLGLPTESRQVRIFGVRNAGGLLVPAANELANPNATRENNGASIIADSENNEPFGVFSAGSAWGWWKAISDMITHAGNIPAWGGDGLRVLLQADDDSYTTQRIGQGTIGNAPTVDDDETQGFLVGSWWVQFIPGEFPLPGTFVLWDCHSNNEGAAIWQQRPLASEVLPSVAGVAAIGTSPAFARADHVHGIYVGPSVEEIPIVNGATVSPGDALAIVAGRVQRSDARPGSVVPGYVGQCIVGGVGNLAGTVRARVVVSGIAPATGLTPASPVYLSTTTLGAVTTTAPSGLGGLSQVVGVALSATEFVVQVDAPIAVDWCSPLDIPTNGIFYGRASSANILASGRIATNGIADLFPASTRVATVDSAGNSPLYVAGGAPGAKDAWFFDAARSDRLRIVHDAGMSGVVWTAAVMHFATSAASQRCLVAKCNGGTPSPLDFHIVGVDEIRLEGSIGLVSKGWRFDAASRPSSGNNALYSGAARVGGGAISALSAGTDDILIGLRNDLATPYLGRVSGFALWNRQLSAAEHVGLAKWARREWPL